MFRLFSQLNTGFTKSSIGDQVSTQILCPQNAEEIKFKQTLFTSGGLLRRFYPLYVLKSAKLFIISSCSKLSQKRKVLIPSNLKKRQNCQTISLNKSYEIEERTEINLIKQLFCMKIELNLVTLGI